MNDDLLRQAFQRGPQCPTLADLDGDLSRREDDPRRLAAMQHVESCPHCLTGLALAKDFAVAAPRGLEQGVVPAVVARVSGSKTVESAPPSWWKRHTSSRVLASAAAIAALVLVGVSLRERVFSGPGAAANPETGVYRSVAPRTILPAGDLPGAPAEFRWEAVSGARSYQIQISDVDREIVYRGTASQASLATPPALARLMQPGKTLFWKVTALDAAGRPLAESTLERFRVAMPESKR